jgi:hypothetical protein
MKKTTIAVMVLAMFLVAGFNVNNAQAKIFSEDRSKVSNFAQKVKKLSRNTLALVIARDGLPTEPDLIKPVVPTVIGNENNLPAGDVVLPVPPQNPAEKGLQKGIQKPPVVPKLINKNTGNTDNKNSDVNTKKDTNTKQETISLITKKSKNTLFKNNACKSTAPSERLWVWTGEAYDEVNKVLSSLSDVWSTNDGINWKKEADKTNMGKGWERMTAKVVENGTETVYSFGSKYKDKTSDGDNSVYKTKNMIDWDYVGEIPNLSRFFDKSIVRFNNKFWLIGSGQDNSVVWSSDNGSEWTQELTKTIWDGSGRDSVVNDKGDRYDSNSLGAFVLNNKIWYLVYDKGVMTIFSSSDGVNWSNEGALVDSKTSSAFKIGTNTNPSPINYNGEIYIYSTIVGSMSPITIKTQDGVNWSKVTSNEDRSSYVYGLKDTDYAPGYYSNDVVFNGKMWKIGGLNNGNGNDNVIYTSKDGANWDKIQVKDTTFAGPEDRHLSAVTTLTSSSSSYATNLKIEREYNATSFFSGSDEKGIILGKWNLSANSEKNTKNTGPIVISSLSFVGNSYKSSMGNEISTLEFMSNLKLSIDGVLVGSASKLNGPFFETTGNRLALPQTIKFDKPYTINNGESVWVTLTADFAIPKYKNIEYRTYLNGVGFKDENTTSCLTYTDDTAGGCPLINPGRNIYWKN